MWFIIVACGIVIIIRYFFKDKIINKSYQTTALRIQYKKLIEYALNNEPEMIILSETKNSIDIGCNIVSGYALFNIERVTDRILIEWKYKNLSSGSLYSKWQFKLNTDQSEIINVIKSDIFKLRKDLQNKINSK